MKPFAIVLGVWGDNRERWWEPNQSTISIFRKVTMNPPVQLTYANKNALRKTVKSFSKYNFIS
jgi:hypothetical protein